MRDKKLKLSLDAFAPKATLTHTQTLAQNVHHISSCAIHNFCSSVIIIIFQFIFMCVSYFPSSSVSFAQQPSVDQQAHIVVSELCKQHNHHQHQHTLVICCVLFSFFQSDKLARHSCQFFAKRRRCQSLWIPTVREFIYFL